ncbi:MAG: phosphotransferase [Planctomycetes bacterium]|nr:phosphotransferase [Planctomycetota bacterium]MCB9903911.1 phosphotransferase [Planctomycetota bacterium]
MQRPWEADRLVDEAQLDVLLARQFPELASLPRRYLTEGWDNVCFLVGDEWIFRLPRRELGARLMACENALLPELATRLPLPVPRPEFRGVPQDDYPWEFHGYRRLPGETLCRAELGDEARAQLAEPLGRFLRALHETPTADFPGLPLDDNRRLDVAHRGAQIEERLADLRGLGLVGDPRPWRRVLEDVPADFRPASDCLVHGDLYARHLLVDERGALCGVIDWGDAHAGDRALDLGVVHAALPASAHDVFRDAYGPLTDLQWKVGCFKALHSSLMILVYGVDVGDRALVVEGLRSLERLAR